MGDPMMRSRPAEGYPGRYHSVDAADFAAQRDSGWPDFHPEDFCHRCGCQNVSWYIDSDEWNPVMRPFGATTERWQEIICIPCFIELAQRHYGGCAWRVARDEFGTEILSLLHGGPS